MLQPEAVPLLTQLCKCQKISQTWLDMSPEAATQRAASLKAFSQRALTLYTCAVLFAHFETIRFLKSAILRRSQTSQVAWKLIPKTYVSKSKCPKD